MPRKRSGGLLEAVAGALYKAWQASRRRRPPQRAHSTRATGSTAPELEVVGESFYRANLQALFGAEEPGDEVGARAELLLDDANTHDALAVSVHVQGKQVGHLARADARRFRAIVSRQHAGCRRFTCDATILVPEEAEHHFSVRVEPPYLPQP